MQKTSRSLGRDDKLLHSWPDVSASTLVRSMPCTYFNEQQSWPCDLCGDDWLAESFASVRKQLQVCCGCCYRDSSLPRAYVTVALHGVLVLGDVPTVARRGLARPSLPSLSDLPGRLGPASWAALSLVSFSLAKGRISWTPSEVRFQTWVSPLLASVVVASRGRWTGWEDRMGPQEAIEHLCSVERLQRPWTMVTIEGRLRRCHLQPFCADAVILPATESLVTGGSRRKRRKTRRSRDTINWKNQEGICQSSWKNVFS